MIDCVGVNPSGKARTSKIPPPMSPNERKKNRPGVGASGQLLVNVFCEGSFEPLDSKPTRSPHCAMWQPSRAGQTVDTFGSARGYSSNSAPTTFIATNTKNLANTADTRHGRFQSTQPA